MNVLRMVHTLLTADSDRELYVQAPAADSDKRLLSGRHSPGTRATVAPTRQDSFVNCCTRFAVVPTK